MFSSLVGSAYGWWLTGLALIWAVLLLGGFVLGQADAEQVRRMPRWTRLGSTLTLALAAWSWWWVARRGPAAGYALLIALGMTCGTLGDLFMGNIIRLPNRIVGGMAGFGLGHVVYVSALLVLGGQLGLGASAPRWGAWGVWLVIGTVGWYLAIFRGPTRNIMRWAALPYALLLASTAGLASGLAWQAHGFTALALGAGLFLLSDLILAMRVFGGAHFRLIEDIIWLTYGPAQMLIVYSVATALSLFAA